MFLILALVFTGVFVVAGLLLMALGTGASQEVKQTLAMLDSAMAASRAVTGDEVVDIRRYELLSAIPWLNRWLLRINIAPQLRLALYQADLKWTIGGLLLMSIACGVAAGSIAYLRTGTVTLSVVLTLAAGSLPLLYLLRQRAKRFARFEQRLPETLDLMVSALRGGHSLVSALSIAAREVGDPINREFRTCFDEQNFGLELRTAMLNMAARFPIQDLRIVVTAILIQKESGGNLAEVLDKVAQTIRERFRLKRQIMVHTAQGRLTGWILSMLPVVLGVGLYLVNPDSVSVLWKRPVGIKMLYAGVCMTFTGSMIIRKIIRIRV